MTSLQIDELKRSRRRSLSLRVLPDGRLEVRAPLRYPEYKIRAFVQSRAEWIDKQRLVMVQRSAQYPPHTWLPGDRLLWLGEPLALAAGAQKRPLVVLTGRELRVAAEAMPRARVLVERWYKAQAGIYMEERLRDLAGLHGFTYQRLRVSNARTRWGSCSSTGVISLSWRLMMAPPRVIDYVMLHELAHLRQANHSAKFWAIVAGMMPDYKAQRAWLKVSGYALTRD